MQTNYRQGTIDDLAALKKLALTSWGQFQNHLEPQHWTTLQNSLSDDETYTCLIHQSHCIVCTNGSGSVIGMAFLVPSGNPTEIYDASWSYIRFVSVDPAFAGRGIGRKLAALCIEKARQDGERIIALHTSELMAKAIHIYESLGFRVVKEIDRRLGKRYWLYKLDLK